MRHVLEGTSASHGMALGRARLVQPSQPTVDERPLASGEVEAEVERLHEALAGTRAELTELREKLHGALAREVGEFIDTHYLLLEDPELVDGLENLVRKGHYRASAALKMQRDRLVQVFDAMDDPYLRSRREDVDHVLTRALVTLQRQTSSEERKLAKRVGEILVSDNIAPADLAHLSGHGVLGLVTTGGSTYSHSAILARSLHLPLLVGVRDALSEIQDNDLVLVDGENGETVVHPAAQDLARYRSWQKQAAAEGRRLASLVAAPSVTRDGQQIGLYANAELAPEVAQARRVGASGVGLYRTEFLFLQRDGLPDEDEQFAAYRNLVLGMGGLPVTIRTLDLGADKADSAGLTLPAEPNPALGVRGVRLSLRHPQTFATQLRAILRAACYGPVRILVPMVTMPEELKSTRTLIDRCMSDLRNQGHQIPEHVDVGSMIEVPAAAIGVRALLEVADFLAIGTNDLAQYLLAADRNHDDLTAIYDPLQPALLRMIAYVIACTRRAGKPVSLCGEIAGDTAFTPLLLALGLTEFSMHPGQILAVRDSLSSLDRNALRRLAPRLTHAHSRGEIEALLSDAAS